MIYTKLKKMKKSLIIFSLLLNSVIIYAQVPSIQWQKCLGGTGGEGARAIQQTVDSGYIVIGESGGIPDYWVVKLDNIGGIQWQKSLGGTGIDDGIFVQQTKDNGYIVAGNSTSNNGDVTGNHNGSNDYWIAKLDNIGGLQWQKSLGGNGSEFVSSIQQTADSGYIVAGMSDSQNGDVTGNHGVSADYWVVKLDNSGIIQWQKSLGGTATDYAFSIKQTTDGGYIVAGSSNSNDGDVTGNHNGGNDYWVIKLDNIGAIQWQKSLGGASDDKAYDIQQTADGGYIVAGKSASKDGDITGHHGDSTVYDYWLVKLTNMGVIQWQNSFGGTGDDEGQSIDQTVDGGYIVAGHSMSNDGDVIGNHNSWDEWVVKLDNLGAIQWQKSLGGTSGEFGWSIQQTIGGGYIIAGQTNSNDGDVIGYNGGGDFWVVKLDTIQTSIKTLGKVNGINVLPNPSKGIINFNGLQKGSQIEIYDLTGRLIFQTLSIGINSIIDLSNKDNGIYFYKINTGTTIYSGKIIKQ